MTILLQDNFCIYDFVGRDHNRSHTGKHSIEALTSTNVTFLQRISYETTFVSASFDMSRVPGRAMNPRGVLTPISTFMPAVSISRPVAGGQVRREKDN